MAAAPRSAASLTRLCNEAESIIVANILEENLSNGVASIRLGTIRVYKGDFRAGDQLSLIWEGPRTFPGGPGPSKGGRGIFFIKKDVRGNPALIPATNGADLDFSATYYWLPNNNEPYDSSGPGCSDPICRILTDLTWAVENGPTPGRGAMYDLPFLLRTHRGAIANSRLGQLAESRVARANSNGLTARLIAGGARELPDTLAKLTALLARGEGSEALEELKLHYQDPDPIGVELLGKYLADASTPHSLRLATAAALARVHTAQALPHLARLLDDPDTLLQACGVGGLSMFANHVPIGSRQSNMEPWPYRTEETIARAIMDPVGISARPSYYLDFWRNWWLANRDAIQRQSASPAKR